MINEEEINSLKELHRVVLGSCHKCGSGLKIGHHDLVILLAFVFLKIHVVQLVRLAIKHLQSVQNLPDIVSTSLTQLVYCVLINVKPFLFRYIADSLGNCLFVRFLELNVITMVGQTSHFLVLSVIADTYYGSFRVFYNLYQLGYTSSISS